jgi:hypothetical protein
MVQLCVHSTIRFNEVCLINLAQGQLYFYHSMVCSLDTDRIVNNPQKIKQKTGKTLKNYTFWYITPCSPLKVNRRFGGKYRIHLQGRIIAREIPA